MRKWNRLYVRLLRNKGRLLKIAVVGAGYVGLSNAVLLAQHNEVVAVDIVQEKVDLINAKKSPIEDAEVEDFLENRALNLVATTDTRRAYTNADFVIIATPHRLRLANQLFQYRKC